MLGELASGRDNLNKKINNSDESMNRSDGDKKRENPPSALGLALASRDIINPSILAASQAAFPIEKEQLEQINKILNNPIIQASIQMNELLKSSLANTCSINQSLFAEIIKTQTSAHNLISTLFPSQTLDLLRPIAYIQNSLERLSDFTSLTSLSISRNQQNNFLAVLDKINSTSNSFAALANSLKLFEEQKIDSILQKVEIPAFSFQSTIYSLDEHCQEIKPRNIDKEIEEQTQYVSKEEARIGTDVEIYLGKLNPALVNIRRGVWETYNSDNPDRFRQSTHSMRELLRLVLSQAAPDHLFTSEEISRDGVDGKITRKMRVKKILAPETDSNLVKFNNGVVLCVISLYNFFSDVAHTGKQKDEKIRTALIAGDALIVSLLREK